MTPIKQSGLLGAAIRKLFLLLLVMNSALILQETAYADFLDELVMPGKLIGGHAKLEKDCDNCHQSFDKDEQTSLCLDCHEKIAFDINENEGFHGKSPGVENNQCRHCHTDHEGRDKNIIIFDAETFDHNYTDFRLNDGHTLPSCRMCHKKERLFREADSSCHDCHQDQSPHKGEKFQDCQSCHSEKNWKGQDFDHGSTEFPLQGTHKDIKCNACHINGELEGVATECISCHVINDTHEGAFGKKCETCHDSSEWEKTSFDHTKDTEFVLRGVHKNKECKLCHIPGKTKEKLKKTCVSCHAADDNHSGRFGEDCASCHRSTSWQRSGFDHNETDFGLRGKHQKAACNACHKETEPGLTSSLCVDCHQDKDIHQGELGKKCNSCHNEAGWNEKIHFDHDVTHFPLIGLHAVTPCEQCHATMSYTDTSTACSNCHIDEDEHQGSLGKKCQQCHNPNSWSVWNFDHDKETEFPLRLSHQELSCRACHQDKKPHSETSSRCIACHQSDDVHKGRFGRSCDRCHDESSFRKIVTH